MKEKLLISACLLGFCCKYDGGSNRLPYETLAALREKYDPVPVCPEFAAGLPVPRPPCERRDGRVYNCEGRDLTAEFEAGARVALALAERFGCRKALLKERSPTCGAGVIYGGSFRHVCVPGDGTAAEALRAAGIELYGESRVRELI